MVVASFRHGHKLTFITVRSRIRHKRVLSLFGAFGISSCLAPCNTLLYAQQSLVKLRRADWHQRQGERARGETERRSKRTDKTDCKTLEDRKQDILKTGRKQDGQTDRADAHQHLCQLQGAARNLYTACHARVHGPPSRGFFHGMKGILCREGTQWCNRLGR